jgi:hypothetical protein
MLEKNRLCGGFFMPALKNLVAKNTPSQWQIDPPT